MSQENVELAREAVAAWNAGDMERVGELYDPDAVMRYRVPDWPEQGPFVGRDAIVGQFRWLRDTWDDDTLEIIGEPIAAGDRVVVYAMWRTAGRGPGSDMDVAWVYTLRRGRIVNVEFFRHYDEALAAAELSE